MGRWGDRGEQGGAVEGGEGAILDLLVIDTSVVNTLGYRPDSLTRLFVHTSVEKRGGGPPPAL